MPWRDSPDEIDDDRACRPPPARPGTPAALVPARRLAYRRCPAGAGRHRAGRRPHRHDPAERRNPARRLGPWRRPGAAGPGRRPHPHRQDLHARARRRAAARPARRHRRDDERQARLDPRRRPRPREPGAGLGLRGGRGSAAQPRRLVGAAGDAARLAGAARAGRGVDRKNRARARQSEPAPSLRRARPGDGVGEGGVGKRAERPPRRLRPYDQLECAGPASLVRRGSGLRPRRRPAHRRGARPRRDWPARNREPAARDRLRRPGRLRPRLRPGRAGRGRRTGHARRRRARADHAGLVADHQPAAAGCAHRPHAEAARPDAAERSARARHPAADRERQRPGRVLCGRQLRPGRSARGGRDRRTAQNAEAWTALAPPPSPALRRLA